MRKRHITATTKITLNSLLTQNLPDHIIPEKVISSGGVWKDHKTRITRPNAVISQGETVLVYFDSHQGESYRLPPEDIIFENEDVLVVYKPAPLNVHAVPANLHYNLSHGVVMYLQNRGNLHTSSPVSRLDKPVAGLVLYGKNKNAERDLFQLMQKHRVGKWYQALLEGSHGKTCIHVKDHLVNDGKRTSAGKRGKPSESIFITGDSFRNYQMVSIFPGSGRRHQIRFHASHYLSPILGDSLYRSKHRGGKDRIALTCIGYNIPWKGGRLRIRLESNRIEHFFNQIIREVDHD